MFTIRPEQMDALKDEQVRIFADRVLGTFKRLRPEEILLSGEDAVRESIIASIHKALSVGVTSQFWVVRFVLAVAKAGPSELAQEQTEQLIHDLRDRNGEMSEKELVLGIEARLL